MGLLKSIKSIFSFNTIGRLLGSNIFATSFFLGYLPEWSRHWTAFFSVIFSIILLYNTCSLPLQEVDMAYILLLEFIYGFLLANIMAPIFRKAFKFAKLDNITIDAFLAQVLVLGACVPAIFYINKGIIGYITHACTTFMHCSTFIFDIIVIIVTLLGPYFVLRFFDIMEFWPTGKMFLYSELSFNRIIAGIFPALYSIITIYILSFLFFDLTLVDVLQFYGVVFDKIQNHILVVIILISKTLTMQNIYILLKKIGIIGFLDKYGILNMEYYDLKYMKK